MCSVFWELRPMHKDNKLGLWIVDVNKRIKATWCHYKKNKKKYSENCNHCVWQRKKEKKREKKITVSEARYKKETCGVSIKRQKGRKQTSK